MTTAHGPAAVGGSEGAPTDETRGCAEIRADSPTGRWVLTAAVLGSGMALLDGTVVNVALPTIGRHLGGSFGQLQWVVNGYLLTLAALILVGGSLGDRFGRTRVFTLGVGWFALASVGCALAPSMPVLIAARVVQGIGGAMLTPGSLAMIQGTICREDRARTIGRWVALTGIAAVAGPLLGGWLVENVGWRWIFWINLPVALLVITICLLAVPDSQDPEPAHLDLPGMVLAVVALGGITYGLIHTGPAALALALGVVGVLAGIAFVLVERRRVGAMVPMALFRIRVFSAANLLTLLMYGALGVITLFVVLELQIVLGWGALRAGLALMPLTVIMLLFSGAVSARAERVGHRTLMSVGPIVCGAGTVWLSQVGAGSSYLTGVLPGTVVFAVGLVMLVAPLTASVLAAAPDRLAGTASGINNAIARTGTLLAVAALPGLVGLRAADYKVPSAFQGGYERGLLVAAALLVAAGLTAFFGLRRTD